MKIPFKLDLQNLQNFQKLFTWPLHFIFVLKKPQDSTRMWAILAFFNITHNDQIQYPYETSSFFGTT